MEEAIKKAKKLGYKKIYLQTVFKDYYEKFGWKLEEKVRIGKTIDENILTYKL